MTYFNHTTWERLYKAVSVLATSPRRLQERLQFAQLELSPLKAEEFPKELQDKVPFVYRPGSEGLTHDEIANLTDEKARELATQIVDAYDEIATEYCQRSVSAS